MMRRARCACLFYFKRIFVDRVVKSSYIGALIILAVFSQICRAQDSIHNNLPRIGIGFSIQGNFGHGYEMFRSLVLPIDFSSYRIEPAVFLGSSGRSSTTDGSVTDEYSQWAPSIGFFFQRGIEHTINYYVGIRLALHIYEDQVNYKGSVKDEGYSRVVISPTAGIEWMVSHHFSIGLEEQNNFSLYQPLFDSEISVGISLLFRWHF
jgi:hypothetical protein